MSLIYNFSLILTSQKLCSDVTLIFSQTIKMANGVHNTSTTKQVLGHQDSHTDFEKYHVGRFNTRFGANLTIELDHVTKLSAQFVSNSNSYLI